ncbi:MAG: hypothetical protein CMM02_16210 [Rhodopirellula sp.]|nr:hypothetical protein [Rhodopirellula sp.]
MAHGALSQSTPVGRTDRAESQSWAKRMARNIQDASGLGGTKPALTLQTMNILYSSEESDVEENDKVAASAAAAAAAALDADTDHTSGSSVSGSCSDSESRKQHSSARRKRKKKRKSVEGAAKDLAAQMVTS